MIAIQQNINNDNLLQYLKLSLLRFIQKPNTNNNNFSAIHNVYLTNPFTAHQYPSAKTTSFQDKNNKTTFSKMRYL